MKLYNNCCGGCQAFSNFSNGQAQDYTTPLSTLAQSSVGRQEIQLKRRWLVDLGRVHGHKTALTVTSNSNRAGGWTRWQALPGTRGWIEGRGTFAQGCSMVAIVLACCMKLVEREGDVKATWIVACCLGDGSVQNRYELGLARPKIVYSHLRRLLGGGGPYQQIKVYSRGQELKWNWIEHRQLGMGPLMHQIYVILVKKTQREVTQ